MFTSRWKVFPRVLGLHVQTLDLKDAYFLVPLHQSSQEKIRFQWQGKIYQFLCLCFGLGPAPKVFTNILKVPIALMRQLNVRMIIFLDDIHVDYGKNYPIFWGVEIDKV
jgi:hypothetical protein